MPRSPKPRPRQGCRPTILSASARAGSSTPCWRGSRPSRRKPKTLKSAARSERVPRPPPPAMTNRLLVSCLLLPLALTLCVAASAHGAVRFGVTEDAGKYADDGGATFFPTLTDLGMTQNRITVFWDAAHPSEIQEKAFLDRSLPVAAADHVDIVFSVQPRHPTDVTSTPGGALGFASYVALLARAYPQVKQFVIGNEPNQPRFWRPQFSASGRGVSAAAYEQVLTLSYDALKAVDPTIDVIGLG